MTDSQFKALLIEEEPNNYFKKSILFLDKNILSKNEVTIQVQYSALNYKDALSASGNKGITRKYPHIPGIDAAGIVIESNSPKFVIGQEVIVTGKDLGMNTFGGFSELISVPADWVIVKPDNLTLKEAMIYGTAGFTAATGIMEIQNAGITPSDGKILITGATGAVGSMAISILSKLGYSVIASTGKLDETEHLLSLGASQVIHRDELNDESGKPLLSKRWIAAVDTVGGTALSMIIRSTADRGVVTNCGMIGSNNLDVSVFPFILRAVRLVGIASAETPMKQRLQLWEKLSGEYKINFTNDLFEEIILEQLSEKINLMLEAKLRKKILVNITK
jgi:acrylyl-CoA reductase (NADPH)